MPELNLSVEGLSFLPISSIYIALNGLIMLGLAFMVVRARQANAKSGHKLTEARDNWIRAHANNTEYVPMALIVLAALEFQGGAAWLLHGLGIVLTLSRIAHGYGRGIEDAGNLGRMLGTLGTWIVLAVAPLTLLYYVIA